jgi:hypothetical protein
MIEKLEMLPGDFHGARTAYSSNSVFIAILTNPKVEYDPEVIGSAIFSTDFGSINPPGPSFGFGVIVLTGNEGDGKVAISDLKVREDDDGKKLTQSSLKGSLEEYFDGFFIVNKTDKCIRQIKFGAFWELFKDENEYKLVQFCEFEPDDE